jgi:hypothetical protein
MVAPSDVLGVVADDLPEVADDVLVGQHHTGGLPRRTRGVLQVRRAGRRSRFDGRHRRAQRVDLDDLSSATRLAAGIRQDGAECGRSGQDHGGSRVPQRAYDPLVQTAGCRDRQGNGDKTGMHGPEEGDDVIHALRGQDRRPVTG